MVVPILIRAFVAEGEAVAPAGRGRDLGWISIATDQKAGLVEMRYQPKEAVEPLGLPLGEHAFGFRSLVGKELALFFVARTEEVRLAMA